MIYHLFVLVLIPGTDHEVSLNRRGNAPKVVDTDDENYRDEREVPERDFNYNNKKKYVDDQLEMSVNRQQYADPVVKQDVK